MHQIHPEGAVRHAEKRRRGTCEFANRIARISLETYESTIPKSYREAHKQTCLAAIVACFKLSERDDEKSSDVETETDQECKPGLDHLQVMGLGVGTKFLSSKTLQSEPGNCTRIRDCHAEVLARRAFRRQLLVEIENQLYGRSAESSDYVPILEPMEEKQQKHTIELMQNEAKRLKSNTINDDTKATETLPKFRLKQGVTLHFYASSAPCGNATLKKFVKMEKETFDTSMPPNQWPQQIHSPIPPHSLRLGQFALLVKKDSSLQIDDSVGENVNNTSENTSTETVPQQEPQTAMTKNRPNAKPWPYRQDDSWCPPSCSITNFNKGTIHSCSDKLCRWNCLGLQGSLLMTLLEQPVYMSTLTVGRKFSRAICQRAVCCRAEGFRSNDNMSKYRLNHPALMETNVYMDETGAHNMEGVKVIGRDATFDSSNSCWVWWPGKISTFDAAECIDGKTGLVINYDDPTDAPNVSEVSSQSYANTLVELLQQFCLPPTKPSGFGLEEMIALKQKLSPDYEAAKAELLRHRVFREWSCRHNKGK